MKEGVLSSRRLEKREAPGGLGRLARSLWAYRLVRWGLAGAFLWAGAVKLADPAAFAVVIEAFGLAPGFMVEPLALALPALEVAAALALAADARGGLGVITGLTVLFALVLGYGLWLGLDIDCGCYGPGDPEAEAFSGLRASLYRDLGFLAAAAYLYWWRGARRAAAAGTTGKESS
jgi:hypothetical protein